ncbi:AAA family ATPase, partial [Cutibacterium acnes]
MAYLRRTVDTELDELFDDVPAIAIDGPKAVGKTTTAQHRAEGTLRLDDPATRSVTQADPSTILLRNRPLLVDEWQHVPAVWDVIRHSVDDDPHGGQFLLAGSATPY